MERKEQEALLFIVLQAAYADGAKDGREREAIRRIVEAMSGEINTAAVHQDALMGRRTLAEAVAALTSPGARQYAYEMAVGVCDADGAHSPAEKAYLDRLAGMLGLDAVASDAYATEAAAVAAAPLAGSLPAVVAVPVAGSVPGAVTGPGTPTNPELDRMILDSAILNGALELMPQSLATMAIIPLQMKLVYRIGKAHGFELDRGHVKDFLMTAGVGLTSQYVEQFGRRLLGGLLGKVAGGIGRTVGSVAAGAGFSFASTYALGQVAKRYYAGGRTLSAEDLQAAFAGLVGEAKQLQSKYLPAIRERASNLDTTAVLQSLR